MLAGILALRWGRLKVRGIYNRFRFIIQLADSCENTSLRIVADPILVGFTIDNKRDCRN